MINKRLSLPKIGISFIMANAQLQIKFVDNERGGQSLVHNDFRFVAKNRRNDRVYWRCAVRTCPATIRTLNNIPVGFNDIHNHQPDRIKLQVSSTMGAIKKRCREETKAVPQIYHEEIAKLRTPEWDDDTQDVVKQLPTYQSCHSILYRQRSKLLPKLPTSTTELVLQGEFTQTTAGEPFLLSNDGDREKILLFSTTRNLQHLAANSTIYGDGTFYTRPSLFSQLYTLHGIVDDQMYPLVYALLPGKGEVIYTRFLQLLKTACSDRDIDLQPTRVFFDYESAVQNAARAAFPGVDVRGCFFHYTQCIWRKVQNTGLQIPYQDDEAITKLVRRAAVLPLVPRIRWKTCGSTPCRILNSVTPTQTQHPSPTT